MQAKRSLILPKLKCPTCVADALRNINLVLTPGPLGPRQRPAPNSTKPQSVSPHGASRLEGKSLKDLLNGLKGKSIRNPLPQRKWRQSFTGEDPRSARFQNMSGHSRWVWFIQILCTSWDGQNLRNIGVNCRILSIHRALPPKQKVAVGQK